MNFKRDFKVNTDTFTVKPRIITFFTQQGYMSVEGDSKLKFTRGSKKGTFTSFNPANCETFAAVELKQRLNDVEVNVNLDVNTSLGIVTKKDKAFWENEMGRLESFIETPRNDLLNSLEAGLAVADSDKEDAYGIKGSLVTAAFILGVLGIIQLIRYIMN
jgi:hypothetical protein